MSTYQKMYERFETDFMGCIATGVLVQSIFGAIAAMYVLHHGNHLFQMIQLFVVVAVSMGFNGAVLSQQKPKTTFNILLVSLSVNTIIAVANML